jgi:hypothetical protein
MASPYQDEYLDTVSFRLVIFCWTEALLLAEEEEQVPDNADPSDVVDRAYSLRH